MDISIPILVLGIVGSVLVVIAITLFGSLLNEGSVLNEDIEESDATTGGKKKWSNKRKASKRNHHYRKK